MKIQFIGATHEVTGSCPITSNPIITMIYMGVIGLLLSGLFGKGCDGKCNM